MKREHLWADHQVDAHIYRKLKEGGYATPQSVRQGEQVTLHISNSRSYYDVFVFREGACRELVQEIHGLRGALHAVPEHGYRDGFGWPETVTIRIPADWKSGVYIATFPTAQGIREILFVVRPREPVAPTLLTVETNTYAAYNGIGGKCFFPLASSNDQHTNEVTFERPLQPDTMGGFYTWDQFTTSWLDAEGYEVDYCVNADHDAEPGILEAYRAHLRIGHGEYTSRNECEQLQRFVAGGGNLIVLAGNSFWHVVETRDRGRRLYCDKTRYEKHPLGTPEKPRTSFLIAIDQLRQRTIGVHYTSMVDVQDQVTGEHIAPTSTGYGGLRVVEPCHWAFDGTGLEAGASFGFDDSIVGVECDGGDVVFRDGKPCFTGADGISPHYRIVAIGDAVGGRLNRELGIHRDAFYCTVAVNETEFKGTVFTAATMEWGHGLYRDDSAVARITRNVLDRLGAA